MATYRLDTEKIFMQILKIESAKIGLTMKEFIISAVREKIASIDAIRATALHGNVLIPKAKGKKI
jgi:hypothetical protein